MTPNRARRVTALPGCGPFANAIPISGLALALEILCLAAASGAQTNVTPAQYLASQPKPHFKTGHHLPHLSKYGWPLPYDLSVETATNWGYALDTTSYRGIVDGGLERDLADSNSAPARMVALCSNYPGKFVLSVNLDRSWPTNLSTGFWVTNAAGLFVDDRTNTWQFRTNPAYTPIVSPEASAADLQIQAESIVAPLRVLRSNAPIAIILNGGERDLGVVGYDRKAWQFDPRVQASAVVTNPWSYSSNRTGMSWPRYCAIQKARHLAVLTSAVRAAVPDRELYVWYNTGNEQARFNQPGYDWENEWANWGWLSDTLNPAVEIPSFENYYTGPGSFTNAAGAQWNQITDLLTRHLNAVGYNLAHGYPTNYSWVCGGWSNTDTNRLADIPRYMGLLKCLYTSGTVGANAGYYAFPISQTNNYLFGGPGFAASFPADSPPHWLLQIQALAHVHALFSYVEDFLWNGDLLAGPTNHLMSADQPAYEFPTGDPNARVLARKLRAADQWLVTAWAQSGSDRPVSVTIPILGQVSVLARASGAVYRASITNAAPQLNLIDPDGLLPTLPPPAPTNLRVTNPPTP